MNKQGYVVLVGAGPGDAELLTLKGQKALKACDVVVYDRLVNEDILKIAEQAEFIFVGKESGRHPAPQDEINAILLKEAQKGKRVVRLKGGDPYLFGRGAEERDYLKRHGVLCEVIPGVTSAIAAPALAGIPVTARGVSQSVHIVTGHAKSDGELDTNYKALAHTGGTLVFLMSVNSCPSIVLNLIEAGMNKKTPAAFVENGTLESARRIDGTLETIAERARQESVQSPAILIIGDVCEI